MVNLSSDISECSLISSTINEAVIMLNSSEWVSEWASDCCLMANVQFFSYSMARTGYISMRWW
jgi:hypothetical protein